MQRTTRIVFGGLAALVGVTAAAGFGGHAYVGHAASARLARTYPQIDGKDIPIPYPLSAAEVEALREERRATLAATTTPADPSSTAEVPHEDPLVGVDLRAVASERALARARTLLASRVPCGECHGLDGAGKLVADAMPVWRWYAPNITAGGKTAEYVPRDWDRLIRHGIKPNGTPATMPSEDFQSLSDQEVSDLAWYYSSLPPIAVQQPPIALGPVGKALIGLGQLPLSVDQIDHARPRPALPPTAAITVEYGAHVAAGCVGCHGMDFAGGPIRQGPPEWPPAANLTPHADGLEGWTKEQFVRVFREGRSRDGRALRTPMVELSRLATTDVDLEAMFLYLQQLPPTPTGG